MCVCLWPLGVRWVLVVLWWSSGGSRSERARPAGATKYEETKAGVNILKNTSIFIVV